LSKNHCRTGHGADELSLVADCMSYLILLCKSV
jgi:hypothetical protein